MFLKHRAVARVSTPYSYLTPSPGRPPQMEPLHELSSLDRHSGRAPRLRHGRHERHSRGKSWPGHGRNVGVPRTAPPTQRLPKQRSLSCSQVASRMSGPAGPVSCPCVACRTGDVRHGLSFTVCERLVSPFPVPDLGRDGRKSRSVCRKMYGLTVLVARSEVVCLTAR